MSTSHATSVAPPGWEALLQLCVSRAMAPRRAVISAGSTSSTTIAAACSSNPTGAVQNAASASARLHLTGPGGPETGCDIPAGAAKSVPKVGGRAGSSRQS